MAETEFYDVGPNRGRPEIDSSNRTQAQSRIQANREDAIVMDHGSKQVEVWVNGQLGDRFALGTKMPDQVLRDLKGDR